MCRIALPTSQLIPQPFRCFTYVTAHSPTFFSLLLRHSLFTYVTWRAARTHSPTFPSLYLRQNSFSNPYFALPTSQLILQPFRCFTYVTAHSPAFLSLLLRHSLFTYVTWRATRAHSPTFPSLHLRHNSFSNPSVALPTSQLILHPFRCFTYVTTHSPILFRFSYVTGSSLTSPGVPPKLILQPFRHFTYVKTHSPILPLLYLRHSSFSNPSFASLTSQALHLRNLASRQSSFSNLSVTSPTSKLILQPFRRFTYATAHSPTLPLLYLRHSSFSNPSFSSITSQALHLRHLASRP